MKLWYGFWVWQPAAVTADVFIYKIALVNDYVSNESDSANTASCPWCQRNRGQWTSLSHMRSQGPSTDAQPTVAKRWRRNDDMTCNIALNGTIWNKLAHLYTLIQSSQMMRNVHWILKAELRKVKVLLRLWRTSGVITESDWQPRHIS